MLLADELFELPRERERKPFDSTKIEVLDWTGVDLRQESHGPEKLHNSIQRRVMELLDTRADQYDIIFDDDGSGECADIVALRKVEDRLRVELYHSKFSSSDKPGARIDDLYAVCGQAQKSIRWREYPRVFLKHLLKREADRHRNGGPSRLEKGSAASLNAYANGWRDLRYEFHVFVVQPGLSKQRASDKQLDLLAATELYLLETWGIPLRVYASA